LKSLMKDLGISRKEAAPSVIGGYISWLKNCGILPSDFMAQHGVPLQGWVDRLYGPYQEALKAMNAMDFDDLLLNFRTILQQHGQEREGYAERFRYILVDEFQDTNRIQYDIVKLLGCRHRNLCVVGDPDQSIYSFRGAEIGNIMSFPDDYPDARIVSLETNYRSTATILRFAQEVISHNVYRHEKELRPSLGEGEAVLYRTCSDGREEAWRVAQYVGDLLLDGVEASQISVFYRARFLSRGLEEAFKHNQLPYQVVGDLGFFERKEIKDVLAFLRVCVNPFDNVSLSRILNVPPRGIGKVTEEKLYREAARAGLAAVEFLRRGMQVPGVGGRSAAGLAELGRLLDEGLAISVESVNGAVDHFLERTGYVESVCRTGTRLDVERGENLRELLSDTMSFDERLALGRSDAGRPELQGQGPAEHGSATFAYLSQVSLMTDAGAPDDDNAVQLMTVHAAKGLEFDHVFVIGLEDGIFPHSQSLSDEKDLEEERRLFYVAATRARKRLFCLRAEFRRTWEGRSSTQQPSRFLREADLEAEHASAFDSDELYETGPEGGLFRVGERVRHENFGEGRILRSFGRGPSMKVEVQFRSGTRVLLVEYANLVRVEGM
ncbi:MAG: ATP-dependent helicase, partial [Planctomycetota bacterium]